MDVGCDKVPWREQALYPKCFTQTSNKSPGLILTDVFWTAEGEEWSLTAGKIPQTEELSTRVALVK